MRPLTHQKNRFDEAVKQRTAGLFKMFQVPFFRSIPEDLFAKVAVTAPSAVIERVTFVQLAKNMDMQVYPPNTSIYEQGMVVS